MGRRMTAMAFAMLGAGHPLIAHLVRTSAVKVLGGFFSCGLGWIQRGNGQHQGSG